MDPHTHTSKRSASAVEGMEEQGSTQKPKLDPTEDLWSEDEHRRLDEEILEECGAFPPASFVQIAILAAPAILSKIHEQILKGATEFDSALVGKQRTLDAMLPPFRNNDTLREMTLKAWEEGSFKEIRNCGKCFLSFRPLYFV
jgi:hypothetical protein